MEENYEVLFEGMPVGKVQAHRSGLYDHFSCRCQLQDQRIYRLILSWENGWENLGILVPDGTGLALNKKIPAKRIPQKPLAFLLLDLDADIENILKKPETPEKPEAEDLEEQAALSGKQTELYQGNIPEEASEREAIESDNKMLREGKTELFVPVDPEQPFEYLDRLEGACYEVREDQPGVLLAECPQENQMSRESPTGQWSEPSTSE